jgi:hypothetical protein
VPLRDADGSTIALVKAASPNIPPPTTYTYDAFGNPTASRTVTNFPFLFKALNTSSAISASFGQVSNRITKSRERVATRHRSLIVWIPFP